ncbi:hypothetical protein ACF06X_12475 [Streptomyces sp. NPDC015346]|uniref:hypothetical protein n=1 Tax=Streptomyces sp. NPDC015346 TaxID=3364954 RepID=UPI0036FB8FC0
MLTIAVGVAGAVDGSTELAEVVTEAGLVVEVVAESLEGQTATGPSSTGRVALARGVDLPLAGVEETEQLLGLPDRKN